MSDIVDYTLGGTAATLAFAPLSLITDCEIQKCLIRTVLQRAVFIFFDNIYNHRLQKFSYLCSLNHL